MEWKRSLFNRLPMTKFWLTTFSRVLRTIELRSLD